MSSFNLFLSTTYSHQNRQFFIVAVSVIALHLGLLGLGKFWSYDDPAPKLRAKVIVQTIKLNIPTQQSVEVKETISSSIELEHVSETTLKEEAKPELLSTEAKPIEPLETKPEEIFKEEVKTPVPIPEPAPKPNVMPSASKDENIVESKSVPKPIVKPETKKKSIPQKNVAPAKKQEQTVKKATPAVEKKQVKKSNAEELKRQKEKEESEKRRQQEKAQMEKKRQQELAAVQEAARQKEKALLTKAKETLAKMEQTRDKISSSLPSINLESTNLPKVLGSLQVDALPLGGEGMLGDWGTKEISYSGEVAARLKVALRFPDYGAVKIKLTLDRSGKVVKVETVETESSKNKIYVEGKIPSLLFPAFGQRFQGALENTFMITLQND